MNIRGNSGRFGLFVKGDEGIFGFGEVIVRDERGSRTEETGNFKMISDGTGDAKSGIFGGIFLIIGLLVAFVDDDKPEVSHRGKKGGTGADNDFGDRR